MYLQSVAGATVICFALFFIGSFYFFFQKNNLQKNAKLSIVCTTSIIADAVKSIVQDTAEVHCLMGPGIDPHLYRPTHGDMQKLSQADIILYHGLHLEGKMSDLFAALRNKKLTYAVAETLEKKVLIPTYGHDVFDPHVWHDVLLWKHCVQALGNYLGQCNSVYAPCYAENTKKYCAILEKLHAYVILEIQKIPEEQRILVTAHDAFRYFGVAYGVQVEGLQGTSTDSEISIADIQRVARVIVEKKIKTVFLESSIPGKGMQALQAAVAALGWTVRIGDHLYSDTLMEAERGSTYDAMVRHNLHGITTALQ